jgi:hypothetical protein
VGGVVHKDVDAAQLVDRFLNDGSSTMIPLRTQSTRI